MMNITYSFKKVIRDLFQVDYIVVIENGKYKVLEKDSRKEHFSFASNSKNKGRLLSQFYSDMMENARKVDNLNKV